MIILNENMIEPEANGKYVIKTLSFASFYLPSVQDVSVLLGLPYNLRKMIPLIEAHYSNELNIGRSTQAKIHTEGFAKPTLIKLINWFNQLPIPLANIYSYSSFRKSFKAMRANSNAGIWYSYLNGAHGKLRPFEFNELFDFIEQRSNADYLMLSSYKKQVKKGIYDKHDVESIWQHQLPFWQQTGLIPSEDLDTYTDFSKLYAEGKITTEAQSYPSLPALIAMRFDFYFAAIANYEVGLLLFTQRNGDDLGKGKIDSFMWPVMELFAISDEPYSCFGAMLERFKYILSKQNEEMSWRTLATYIPINASEDSAESINDRQYKQLKDWKNNKNLPSDAKFRAFVEAAVEPLGDYSIEHILIYARISKALNTLVLNTYNEFKSEHTLAAMEKMFMRYPLYFAYYKEQALLKQKATA